MGAFSGNNLMWSTDHFCGVQIHQKAYEENTIKNMMFKDWKDMIKSEVIILLKKKESNSFLKKLTYLHS